MACAIAFGLLASGCAANDIFVSDRSSAKLNALKAKGIGVSENNLDTVSFADVLILAVKPNIIPIVLKEIKNDIGEKIVVSIAAGVEISKIESFIGKDKKIIRTMPNTPAQVRCGMTVISPNKNISENELSSICEIFNAVGDTVVLEEKHINTATALHSSSPAYIYMMIDAMANAGLKYGIPKDTALKIVAKAVEGSAKMVMETKEHPAVLCDKVCSPGGTTIAAVWALEEKGFKAAIEDAIDACVKKADELS